MAGMNGDEGSSARGEHPTDDEADALGDVFDVDSPDPDTATTGPVAIKLPPGVPPAVAAAIAAAQAKARAPGANRVVRVGADDTAGVDRNDKGDRATSIEPDGGVEDNESVPAATPDMFELLGLDETPKKTDWRRLPHTVRMSLAIVWRAARWRAAVVALLQLVAGLGLGAQLLAGNSLLARALTLRDTAGGLASLAPQALWVAAIATVLATVQAASNAQQRVLSELVGAHAFGEIMNASASADLVAFEDSDYYNRLQRAVAGGQMRPFQLVLGLLQMLSAVLGAAGISLALFALQPLLVPLALLAGTPVWIATTRNARAQFFVFLGNVPDERERQYLRTLLTERDAAKEVRAFNLVGYLRRRHDDVSRRVLARIAREAWRNMRRALAGQAGSGIAALVGGLTVLWMLVSGRLPIAAAMTAAIAMQQLRARVVGAAVSVSQVFESALYLDDYARFVSEAKPIPTEPSTVVAPFARLAAEGVSFSYPGSASAALDAVDVEINAGEVIALVGENGSGKTTLAKLLCGLYAPTGGRVLWDGTAIDDLDTLAMREKITVIFQDFIRYALPARDNVGLGRHQLLEDSEAIDRAVGIAGLRGVFDQLPEKWDTVLGRQFTGGQDLSGGQWQRVALARAFFRDAAFLVLDEPTAALDARAEHRLFQRLRELAAGRSVLLITHRFGNVRMADRIYVLHHGRVVEHGSHDELIARDGRYAELFGLQASQYLGQPSAG